MEAYILDKNYSALDIVDQYKSFIWTDRYNECGDFELHMLVKKSTLEYLKPDNYLWRRDTDRLMLIENIELSTDVDGDFLIVTGRSLESLLDRRVIWNRKVFDGTGLETVISMLLSENAISPSDPNRAIPNLIFRASNDTRITSIKVNQQYLGENLYEAIVELCQQHDVGWRILLESNNQMVFQLYAGNDRSYNQDKLPYVVFSDKLGNLLRSNYLRSKKNIRTAARIGGEEDDETKVRFMTETGSGKGLDRKEIYVDASSESRKIHNDGVDAEGNPLPETVLTDDQYRAQLVQKGNEELSKHKIEISFDGEMDTTRQFVYDRDFFIGDLVQVMNEYDVEDVCRVTEVVRTHDDSGEILTPTFTSKTSTD